MSGAATPQVLLEPIAADAGPTFITAPMPESPTGTNAASVQGGFPPVTMQAEGAGGKPPLGQDMNGYLFLISSHSFYTQCGQLYLYDSTLAAAISGYKLGTILGMADGSGIWLNISDGNTSNPDTGGAGWVPMAAYGTTTVAGLVGGTVTLTAAQTRYSVIILQGTLVGNLAINLPPTKQEWLIVNGTTGAFSTTVKTASGSGVTVPQGGFAAPTGVYSVGDGNIYPTVAPLSVPIDQNPTPLTLVERTNAGYVLATYFNSNTGLENPTVGAVIVQNSGADGFFRKIGLTNFEAQLLLQGLGGQLVNGQVPFSVVAQWASALFSSPTFTGVPTAPTAGSGTSNTQVATTAFANPGVTVNANGVAIRLPSGYILQCGFVTNGSTSPNVIQVPITFPVAFPTQCIAGFVATANRTTGGANDSGGITSVATGGMVGLVDLNSAGTAHQAYWFAIGN